MKTKFLLLILVITLAAACRSSKAGCEGSKSVGPKFKATKFSWDQK